MHRNKLNLLYGLFTACCALGLAATVSVAADAQGSTGMGQKAAQEHGPHGVGCKGFRFNLDRELKLFSGKPERLVAGAADAAPEAMTEHLYEVQLQPQEQFKFAVPPDKQTVADGSYAGVLRVLPKQEGILRVTVNEQAWLDVVAGGSLMTSSDHTGSADCELLHKSVQFPIKARQPLLIQISGSTVPSIKLTLTQPR